MKERGEKFAMLTAYEQYAAQTFDEAGIEVLLVGDSASNNVYGNETSLPVTVDELIPLTRAVSRSVRRALVVGDLPVRLLPGLAGAGLRDRRPVHEGGRRALREARGRPRDGAADRAAHPRRRPGDGAHRLHPAERARPRRLPRPGPRRDRPADPRRRQGGRGRRRVRGRHGDGARRRRRPGHQRSCPSRRSASAPAPSATARCWSGRTRSGCAPAGWRSSSSSTPTCTAYSSTRPAPTPQDVKGGTFPGPSTPSEPTHGGRRSGYGDPHARHCSESSPSPSLVPAALRGGRRRRRLARRPAQPRRPRRSSRPKQRHGRRAHAPGRAARSAGSQIPWDVKPIGGGRLLITERDSAAPAAPQGRRHPPGRSSRARKVWVSGETGLMSLEIDPSFASNGRFYTCSGWKKRRRRPRRPGQRLAAQRRRHPRPPTCETLVAGFPTTQRPARRLPPAHHQRTARCSSAPATPRRQQPAQPELARRQDAPAGPDHRRPWPSNPFTNAAEPQAALRPHLRPPQRAGPGPARRRHAVVGRARPRHRRRGQPARRRRRLRLEPRPRLQRGRADDRPVAARPPVQRPLALRARRRPRRAPPGCSGKQWGRLNGTLAVAASRATG